jgi:tRNA-dihydrouridine synthase A
MSTLFEISVAPMMERTDRHFRYLMRLVSPRARLYTEMIACQALTRGDAERLLAFDPTEHPVAAQLGGNDPESLRRAAQLVADAGYDEVNLNVGCPSPRVQAGAFGAKLMLEPDLVADCVLALREGSGLPVTVKTRIGVDDCDGYELLQRLTESVAAAGVERLIVHARKAWLEGLSPKQNREIPPLDYERVYRLRREFPALPVVINGGFRTTGLVLQQIGRVDGVMLGRAAYHDPLMVGKLDAMLAVDGPARETGSPDAGHPVLADILDRYAIYMRREHAAGTPMRAMSRHLMGLFAKRPGARRLRHAAASLENDPGALDNLLSRLARKPNGTLYNAPIGISPSTTQPTR